MIVIAIIGILASIAVPNYQRLQAKARQSEAKTVLAAIYKAEIIYRIEWDSFFGDFRNIGYQPVGLFRYEHGFGSLGTGNVLQYVGGGVPAGMPATAFNTTNFASTGSAAGAGCGTGPNFNMGCSVDRSVAPGAFTTDNNCKVTTFVAEARGDIDGDPDVDVWTVDQNKKFENTSSDL